MSRKPKFKPEIKRIKLNPEQAVLACQCFNTGGHWAVGHNNLAGASQGHCNPNQRQHPSFHRCGGAGGHTHTASAGATSS